jgi:hypothetical protein
MYCSFLLSFECRIGTHDVSQVTLHERHASPNVAEHCDSVGKLIDCQFDCWRPFVDTLRRSSGSAFFLVEPRSAGFDRFDYPWQDNY